MKQKLISTVLAFALLLTLSGCSSIQRAGSLPKGFVYVEDEIPSIQLDIRYYTNRNFVGSRIDGYLAPRCVLTEEATQALSKVQEELKPFGFGLKVFDAYRPQRAVDHFVRWAEDLESTKMKREYYPDVDKKALFERGYIDEKSGHTRGSAVDVTVISLSKGNELDMGSAFDFFGQKSWPHYKNLSQTQRANRLLLQAVMTKHGFNQYDKEWWHFWLDDEPFPETYFDFPIQ